MATNIKQTLFELSRAKKGKYAGTSRLKFLAACIKNKKKSVMFASFPKAGWNWTGDILSYVVTKHFTGKFDVSYKGAGTLKEREVKPFNLFFPADSRISLATPLRKLFPELDVDYRMHTHGHKGEAPLWGTDTAKTVIISRHIPTNLFSYYKSRKPGSFSSFQECVESYALDRAILFYNSWGEAIDTGKINARVFKYEDYKTKPSETFAELVEYDFGFKPDMALVEEAIEFYNFENQKKREFEFCEDESKHFHFKGSISYEKEMPGETLDYIKLRLRNELKFSFGYEY